MTSEAPHRPGQEPGEVSPGAGGPAPYGDRPAQQDNGYPGAPDLGWAPPAPAGGTAPAWAAQDEPATGWSPPGRGAAQVPPPTESGGWDRSGQPAWGAPEQNPPAWTGGTATPNEPGPPTWGTPAEPAAPAWNAGPPAGQAEQPAWAQSANPNARGAVHVPAPATTPEETWNVPAGQQQDDPSRSGGWPAPQQDDEAARSGGWAASAEPQPDRSGGWPVGTAPQQQPEQPAWGQQDAPAPAWAPTDPPARASAKVPVPGAPAEHARPAPPGDPAQSGGWQAGPPAAHQDDPDGSGGWAAGRAAAQPEASQPGWDAADEQRPSWTGAAAVPQQRDQDAPAQPGWAPADRPDAAPWSPAEAPARASASVPSPDSPPSWAGNQDEPAQWSPPQPPAIPAAEPWAASEAWGRAAEAEPAEAPANDWQPNRGTEAPAYQPAPGPGISPANAVPLPPQEQRVPGAALAASPPADYVPPAQYSPAAEAADRDPQGYEPERNPGWGGPETPHEEPQSPAGPVVPAPRTSPESGTSGHVSASASVPLASRVMPPTDQSLRPAATPAPQPRVYGRPVAPEPEEVPGHDAPNGYPGEAARFDEPGPRGEEPDAASSSAYAEAPPAPSSPAGPPPFPPGVPSFMDPAANNRPVNGVHPQGGDHPGDPFGGPPAQREPYGAPSGQDPFAHQGQYGGPGGQPEQFGGPAGGRASVAVPGQGPGGPGQGGFPPAFPPPPQQAPPAWQQGPAGDSEQGRFDSFKPEAEPKTEAPAPKVRNGRVLALVLIAAVLILAVPLGLLTLLGKIGGDDEPAPFDPAVGSCVKQSGNGATAAQCAEPGAFSVVAKVDSKEKCADPAQPHVVLPGDGTNRVLCLKPAATK